MMEKETSPLTNGSPSNTETYGGVENTAFQDETHSEIAYTSFPEDEDPEAEHTPMLNTARPRAGRLTLDEVMYNIRYSNNKGFDWSEDIDEVEHEKGREEDSVYSTFLGKLREQPLAIRDKLKLSKYLRDHLDTASISESRKAKLNNTEKMTRTYNSFGYELWRNHITKISAYHGTNVASYFQFLRFLVYLNLVMALLLLAFVIVPQILSGEDVIPEDVAGYFGELSTSIAFYGAYSNTTWYSYERPMAYFFTSASVILASFITIILSMLVRYRKSKYGSTDAEFPFTWRLFTAWDHSVYKKEGVVERLIALRTDIKEVIRDHNSPRIDRFCSRLKLFIIRVIVNILVLALLGGSGVLIYVVANLSPAPSRIPDILRDFLNNNELPLTVTGLKVIIPLIFDQLIKLEQWHPRTELKLTIGRTTLFYVASLIVFVASLYDVTTKCISESGNLTVSEKNVSEFCCWENEVGEQVLKVTILDLGITLVIGILFYILRAIIVKWCSLYRVGYPEVDVASGVLELTYGQALIWLGLYFSPFLAAAAVVKLIIIFYFRVIIARTCCVAPSKIFRASRSGSFYMFILLLHLFFSIFPFVYAIIELQPSNDCGPFRVEKHVLDVIGRRIPELPDWLQEAFDYIGTSSVIIPIIILLLLIVFFYMARASSYKNVNALLRNHLTFERRVEKRRIFAKGRVLNEHSRSKASMSSTVF